jgi:hypothetical protein
MDNWKRLVFLVVLWPLPQIGNAQTSIDYYPQSEVLMSQESTQSHLIATGPIRRTNSLLNPESSLLIQGRRQSHTLLGSQRRNVEAIYQYYLKQLDAEAQVIFQCVGRSCGPSTYWANKVFENASLYGPEQYQRYLVARLPKNNYLILYIAQRATGVVYFQHDLIWAESDIDPDENHLTKIVREMKQNGRYVLSRDIDIELIEIINSYLSANAAKNYGLVVHDEMMVGESVQQVIERSVRAASSLNRKFPQNPPNLTFHGVGPIVPIQGLDKERIELVLLN